MEIKLAAVFNVWNDWDWLDISADRIAPLVDGIIVIASEKSNYGEISPIPERWKDKVIVKEPCFTNAGHNEAYKRNHGLFIARKAGYTHYISMDADEIYDPLEFTKAKERFSDPNLMGLVCKSQVYFGSPKLTIGLDTTLVPHIHKITPDLRHEFNRNYPFSWEGISIRIDPTRSFNINSGVDMVDMVMHHYSWVRSDYEKKIRNSSARANLDRSSIREDLMLAQDGYFCKFYQRELVRAQVDFKIPEMNVSSH
jgi:hypothetical protein